MRLCLALPSHPAFMGPHGNSAKSSPPSTDVSLHNILSALVRPGWTLGSKTKQGWERLGNVTGLPQKKKKQRPWSNSGKPRGMPTAKLNGKTQNYTSKSKHFPF